MNIFDVLSVLLNLYLVFAVLRTLYKGFTVKYTNRMIRILVYLLCWICLFFDRHYQRNTASVSQLNAQVKLEH